MGELERRMAAQETAQAAKVKAMQEREAGFRRVSNERVRDFVSTMHTNGVGSTALFETTQFNKDVGGWLRARRVTSLAYVSLGRGWVLSEADYNEWTPSSWMILDEQPRRPEEAPRVLMTTPIVKKAPEYCEPPELPYAALLYNKDFEASLLPAPFAQERQYDMLATATRRLIASAL